VDASGVLRPGRVTFSLQSLLTAAVTGDSAGAHDNGATAGFGRWADGGSAADAAGLRLVD
jgi:hypothetical protein